MAPPSLSMGEGWGEGEKLGQMTTIISAILFSPLAASIIITLFTRRFKNISALIAISSLLASFCLSLYVFSHFQGIGAANSWEASVPWLQLEGLKLEWGYLINPLSLVMLLVVTGIGSLIFIFSWGYMKNDPGWSRYFAGLSFFAFAMPGIVLSNNLLQIFIFWELVGLASYLLISFWFEQEAAAVAGKKAFLVNKIGDIFFLFGIVLIWFFSSPEMGERTLNFLQLTGRHAELALHPGTLTILCLLIFAGVAGKSAQFPLHVWLPDAMEGPTPVSALIHAATMVAAGVYLLARTFFLFEMAPDALFVVGVIGLITCFFSGWIAIAQEDIKWLLAYSTLSQLGYMVMAVGCGGPAQGMFHLVTHACFKALLFLAAGSVIHSVHTQDIWQMGGLRKKMPITHLTFLVGTLALAGIFPFAGFFSKDAILELAFHSNRIFFWGGLVTVFLTAFYMGRLFFRTFWGSPSPRSEKAHESPLVMTLPLFVLALLSVTSGFAPITQFLTGHEAEPINWGLSGLSALFAVSGFTFSFLIFGRKSVAQEPFIPSLGTVGVILRKKFYVDELYETFVIRLQTFWCRILGAFERFAVLGLEENFPEALSRWLASGVRRVQSGSLAVYALLFVAGLAVLGWWGVSR